MGVATSTTSQTSIDSPLQPTTVTGHWLPHTFRMLDTFLSFCSSASFYSAIVMLSLWLWKELTMGIYRGKERLDGKLVVITGANCGIGLETARDLAKRGAQIIVGCRSRQRGEAAVKEIINTSGNSKVEMVELDLLSLASVRRFAQAVAARPEPLSLLINNAGMGVFDEKLHLSDDGLETTLQCNHLSHFLLTNLLRDKLAEAGNARVINVSSFAAWHGKINLDNINYESDSSPAALKYNYHNSKLMNVMFSQEISRRWADLGITAYSNHPGLVRTEVFRHFSAAMQNMILSYGYLTGKDCWQGAQTTIFLALQPGLEKESGEYFADCRNWNCLLSKKQTDPELASGLWERSAKLVKMDM